MSDGQALEEKIWGDRRGLLYSLWPQEERGWRGAFHGGQHCWDPYSDSVYRIILAESSSLSGGIEQHLGGRCWRGNECLDSDLWGTQEPCGAGVHLGVGIRGWASEGPEAVNTSFRFSLPSVSGTLQLWHLQLFYKEDGGQLPSPSAV